MKLFGLLGVLLLLGSYPTLGSRAVSASDCHFDTLPSNNGCVRVGPTCPNGTVVDHVRWCPIRVKYTGPGTCSTWKRINRITNKELEFDEPWSGTSALFTPTDPDRPLVLCGVLADGVRIFYKAYFETVDGATCPVVEPSTAQIDEPTATVPVPDPSSTVQETVGGTETSSMLTSPQPTPTRTPSTGDTDPSFDEAWRTGVIVAVCIVAFFVIAFILSFFTVCVAKRRNNPLPHHDQDPSNGRGGQGIPMERVQGGPPVNHGSAVEESGVELQGLPNDVNGGGGDPTTTTVLGLLSQCAFPSEKEGPTGPESVGLEQVSALLGTERSPEQAVCGAHSLLHTAFCTQPFAHGPFAQGGLLHMTLQDSSCVIVNLVS